MKIYFFGTQNFAKHILSSLITDDNIEILGVVTQPDRPVGRKKIMQASPVKILAQEHGLQIFQPAKLKDFIINEELDVAVVAQYGNLIPKHILDHPKHGMINVHTSLLPKYRGASPIQTALINGDKTTGVTIMTMDIGLDTGDILKQQKLDINKDWTYLDLDKELAHISGDLLLSALHDFVSGDLTPQKQDDNLATHCSQLNRESGLIDWTKSAEAIYNQYRGLTPWPGIWTTWNEKRLKLLKISKSDVINTPGTVTKSDNNILVGTGEKSIILHQVQIEGKGPMDIKQFTQGYQSFCDATLGN